MTNDWGMRRRKAEIDFPLFSIYRMQDEPELWCAVCSDDPGIVFYDADPNLAAAMLQAHRAAHTETDG